MLKDSYTITRMTNVDWDNKTILATFDLETPDGVHRDMRLKGGPYGKNKAETFWVEVREHKLDKSYERKKKDGTTVTVEWEGDFFLFKASKDLIVQLASEMYDPHITAYERYGMEEDTKNTAKIASAATVEAATLPM